MMKPGSGRNNGRLGFPTDPTIVNYCLPRQNTLEVFFITYFTMLPIKLEYILALQRCANLDAEKQWTGLA